MSALNIFFDVENRLYFLFKMFAYTYSNLIAILYTSKTILNADVPVEFLAGNIFSLIIWFCSLREIDAIIKKGIKDESNRRIRVTNKSFCVFVCGIPLIFGNKILKNIILSKIN
ncbi:hypothetical protein GVAV_002629 [Gurleya vavrai]